jgi:transporter family protein
MVGFRIAKMQTWFIFALAALLLWGVWGLFPKLATNYLSPASVMVFSGIGNVLVLIVVLVFLNFRPDVHPQGITFAILAGLLGTLGTIPFLYAISKGKASVVVPMTSLYPLVTIVLSLLILREPMTLKQGVGIVLALIALLLFAL